MFVIQFDTPCNVLTQRYIGQDTNYKSWSYGLYKIGEFWDCGCATLDQTKKIAGKSELSSSKVYISMYKDGETQDRTRTWHLYAFWLLYCVKQSALQSVES